MKQKKSRLLTLIGLIGIFSLVSGQALAQTKTNDGDRRGRTLIVDDDHQCPGSTFTSIQMAVVAASAGDTIKVCPGNYPEQVKITKDLTIVGVPYMNQNAAVVKPIATLPNSSDGVAAIILAENARNVELENLTVDGATNGIASCTPTLAGIYYHNASGEVERTAVRNIRVAGFPGCQSGFGILVKSDSGKRSVVEIEENSIHDYQKGGITANSVGTDVAIHGNAVSGLGPTGDIAQNGIQIGFGAKGSIDNNSVINHIYAACTSAANCPTTASNILVFQSDNVRVAYNTVGKSQVNIFVIGNRADVFGNTSLDADVFDGIDLVGDYNKAFLNNIFNSDDAGVYVQGNRNLVKGNLINEAREGVLEDSPSSGNDLNDNRFYNVVTKVVTAGSSPIAAPLTNTNAPTGRSASPAQP
jgi:hypothetical protein